MPTVLALVIAVAFMQAPSISSASSLAGLWQSTVAVPPGEAPAIEPHFELVIKEGRVEIVFGARAPVGAEAYSAGRGKLPVLVVRDVPGLRGSRFMIIRPQTPNQVQIELFNDPGSGDRGRFLYSEVFKRVK